MKKAILSGIYLLSLAGLLRAQDAADIYLRLGKLREQRTVLYIAAHPDDENTRLITWLSKEKKCRTVYLSLTRGDGGQNLIGAELGVELGLIRTRELMAARKIDGGEQFFTRAFDFGYSKKTDETLSLWDREEILKDVVRLIRTIRPDVIICRFPPDQRAGHGHHSASAVLAHEAFNAAADPERFKDMPEKGAVWKTRRIFWNTFNFGSNNTTAENQKKTDVGAFNPLLGKSYGELAAESRSQHKSQGFGVPAQRGIQWEYFTGVDGDTLSADLFSPAQDYYVNYPGGEVIRQLMDSALLQFDFLAPARSVPLLLRLHRLLQDWQAPEYFKSRKIKELEQLITDCLGLWMAAYSFTENYASGDSIHVTFQSICRATADVRIELRDSRIEKGDTALTLETQKIFNRKLILKGSDTLTQPYWLYKPHSKGLFYIQDSSLTENAWNRPAISLPVTCTIGTTRLLLQVPVQYKLTDPVRGEVYRPLVIQPPLTASISEAVSVFNNDRPRSYKLKLTWHRHTPDSVKLILPSGNDAWIFSMRDTTIYFSGKESVMTISFTVRPGNRESKPASLSFLYRTSKEKESAPLWGQHIIQYDHIPRITWFPGLTLELRKAEITTHAKKLLYIKGAGDDIPAMLRQLGITVEEVDGAALEDLALANYDAIVTGIRAYNTDPNLPQQFNKLMQYVSEGGVMLVQYNTNNNLQPMKVMAPYPFQISRNRVTEEDAAVTFPVADHPLLHTPNKITTEDFKGWIQERGLYFASGADSTYQFPLQMHDTGEEEQNGSLIVAKYGRGRYIYTGLSFFRQLPAGVTGAFRLFANLISPPRQ